MVAMHVECIGTAYEILIQNVQSVNHLLLFNYISFLGGERYNCIIIDGLAKLSNIYIIGIINKEQNICSFSRFISMLALYWP